MSLSINVALLGQQGIANPNSTQQSAAVQSSAPQAVRLLHRVRRATGLASVMNC